MQFSVYRTALEEHWGLNDIERILREEGPLLYKDVITRDSQFIQIYENRSSFVRKYGWGTLGIESILEVVEFIATGQNEKNVLEIGGGTGWFASLVIAAGIKDYVCTDPHLDNQVGEAEHIPIEELKAVEAVMAYPQANVLISVWPTYEGTFASEALALFRGNFFVYVGEDADGCNAESSFFEQLEKEWILVAKADCLQWLYIHDSVFMYRRRLDESDE